MTQIIDAGTNGDADVAATLQLALHQLQVEHAAIDEHIQHRRRRVDEEHGAMFQELSELRRLIAAQQAWIADLEERVGANEHHLEIQRRGLALAASGVPPELLERGDCTRLGD